jgi:hypothetical protein
MWVDFPNAAAAKSFGMSDNKTSEWTEWDEDKLDKLMDDLRATVKDSGSLQILETLTAFSESEISSLSLIPDLDKIKNKVQRDDGLTGVVKLLCKAEDRDTLVAWLEEALPDAKFIGVEIKGA